VRATLVIGADGATVAPIDGTLPEVVLTARLAPSGGALDLRW